MKTKYCWRCKIDVPMLDENEFEEIEALYKQCMQADKEFRQMHEMPLSNLTIEDRFKPVRDHYARITEWKESNVNAILHHRLSLLGPDCPVCGKPLRTSKARICPECGWMRCCSPEAQQNTG